jgi:tRNA(fMet)-specific endonuclease VapC
VYLLDTDIASEFLRGHPTVTARLRAAPAVQVWLSSIAVEEILRGALDVINQERQRRRFGLESVYRELDRLVKELAKFNVLPYDDAAETLFQSWPASIKRIGRQDCRIAASAVAHNLTVVTRNEHDFRRIPGVQLVNWTR